MARPESHSDRTGRFARTGFADHLGDWYSLDNAALIMPSVAKATFPYMVRFSATLDQPVHLPTLQAAMDRMARRFPYFFVEIRRGAFWHYLQPHERQSLILPDTDFPVQNFDMHKRGTCLFHVRTGDRRIALEFNHVLTDGTGGLRFLKNLITEYFRLRGVDPGEPTDPEIVDLDQPFDAEETEDAYNRFFPGKYPHPEKEKPAWHLEGPVNRPGLQRYTSGSIPLEPLRATSRQYKVSITELLVAAYLDALQELWFSVTDEGRRPGRRRTRIALEVPVNMRQFHPTKSNRNFSLFVHIQLDMRLGRRSFPDIVDKVHHQFRHEVDALSMARHIARNVSGGRNLMIRIVPLFIKKYIMKILYSYYGENLISGVLSNLGAPSLPPAVAAHVDRLDLLLSGSPIIKTSAAVMSWKDQLTITFGSRTVSRELERLFFTRLRRLGLPVRIECTMP